MQPCLEQLADAMRCERQLGERIGIPCHSTCVVYIMPSLLHAFCPFGGGGPIFVSKEAFGVEQYLYLRLTDLQVFIVAFSFDFFSLLYALSRSQQLFPPHVSSYRTHPTQFPFSLPKLMITPL